MALTYNQLQTVTREHFRPQLIDQVFKATPVLDRMKKANRLRPKGGDEIHFPVISAKNTFVQKIVKDEVFSTNRADKLTKGVVSWREYVVPITIAKTATIRSNAMPISSTIGDVDQLSCGARPQNDAR